MEQKQSLHQNVAQYLRTIGTSQAIDKAKVLEKSTNTRSLALRNLALNAEHIKQISAYFGHSDNLHSISFSYNPIGNKGAKILSESLPLTLRELGLVGCNIDDKGGIHLLGWIEKAHHLQMICIEQNTFSKAVRLCFQQFRNEHQNIMVIF